VRVARLELNGAETNVSCPRSRSQRECDEFFVYKGKRRRLGKRRERGGRSREKSRETTHEGRARPSPQRRRVEEEGKARAKIQARKKPKKNPSCHFTRAASIGWDRLETSYVSNRHASPLVDVAPHNDTMSAFSVTLKPVMQVRVVLRCAVQGAGQRARRAGKHRALPTPMCIPTSTQMREQID
jgi:hypothetical protein